MVRALLFHPYEENLFKGWYMKNWKLNFNALFLLPLTFLMVNCSKKSDSNKSAVNNYYYSNGMCFVRSTNQQVDPSYCNSQTTSPYYMMGGQCYSTQTRQIVPYYNCQSGNGGMGQQCFGTYWYQHPQYGWIQGQCNGANCSGYTLYLQQGGQPIYCQ